MRVTTSSRRTRAGRWLTAAALATAAVVVPSLAAHADVPVAGTPVWIGDSAGPAGMGLYKVYVPVPGDTSNPGNPNYSGYSLEHDLEARSQITATAVEPSSYLGSNYFTDPTVQRQVLWLLANSYPALTTSQLAYNMGIPTMSQSQAIEATQYAIWRYTEYTSDVNWNFSSPTVQDIYSALLNGVTRAIRDHTLPVRADFEVTATITGPTAAQTADSLVGPFVVHTNKATASVSSDPAQKFTDAAGAPINANAVVDGQAVYLDLRGTKTAGSANVTVSAAGSSATGLVLNVPLKEGDTPTAGAHAQSLILATPSTTSTTASAAVQWTTTLHPSIGTTLVDASDQDHTLAWDGGTLTDTVAYHDLIPGTQYTVAG
ncbi:MAG: Cys-Gln thioester bond-forming surface protein, partial [Actinobacteria bacterium]|nr:Cys-Gln thioester bond-forming surface protein [Actinomycetota bacterium]